MVGQCHGGMGGYCKWAAASVGRCVVVLAQTITPVQKLTDVAQTAED